MRLYIAGPMRGHPLYNFPRFFRAAMDLRAAGHTVANPAERDMSEGFNPALPLTHGENAKVFSLQKAFEWDFQQIVAADGVVVLPGWQESSGVQGELVLAFCLGRKVFELLYTDAGWVLLPVVLNSYSVKFDTGEATDE